jgi:transposase-like protein
MARIKRDERALKIADLIINEYGLESISDIDDALKEVFAPLFEGILKGELNNHLGYDSNDKGEKLSGNRRNGYGTKTLKTKKGNVKINVPRDRDGTFNPIVIPKGKRDVSDIENKVLSMYAKGMSQRDISSTINDIYGFEVSHEMISDITDAILPELNEWQNRPLNKCYAFIFVDCMFVSLRTNHETKQHAVYTMLGINLNGQKEILGIWLAETESKSEWMKIFDEIKARGVDDVFFISMDGLTGLEEGAKAIFPKAKVQRCIVHLIRNSLKYIPTKEYKKFTQMIKRVYSAVNLNKANAEFELLCKEFSQYQGAILVWKNNWTHVEQLFNYGSNVRKVMYTTNAIEAIHSSFRKVTKKGSFANENALFKLLFLRAKELDKKWDGGKIRDWSMVLNQLLADDDLENRINKYINNN